MCLDINPAHSIGTLLKMLCTFNLCRVCVKSMGCIFIGLVKCGAWGCFDELNRLEEAVLSAVSMQIQFIQVSIKSQATSTELLDKQVSLILYLPIDYSNLFSVF